MYFNEQPDIHQYFHFRTSQGVDFFSKLQKKKQQQTNKKTMDMFESLWKSLNYLMICFVNNVTFFILKTHLTVIFIYYEIMNSK